MKRKTLNTGKNRRSDRIRKKINGTPDRPRLSVYRSLNNIFVQIIDDVSGKTLAAASSLSKDLKEKVKAAKGKLAESKIVGEAAAKKALESKITTVVFNRSGYKYHGRIKAIAEAAREAGLKF